MLLLDQLADARIEEAMERGDFDNLPGTGKPLILEDLSNIPEDYRMAYKILKNSGFRPPVLELKTEISRLFRSYSESENDQNKNHLLKKIQYMFIKLELSSHQNSHLALQQEYYKKLTCHFSVNTS